MHRTLLTTLFCAGTLWAAATCEASPSAPTPAATAPQSAPAAGVLDRARLAADLREALARAEAEGFAGNVLIADRGEVIFESHSGYADRADNTRNGPDTRFNQASNGKLFTVVATLQLLAQGKLALDAPVGRYLPDWPQATVRERVTVRHLLTHTSGLGSFFGHPDFARLRTRLVDVPSHMPIIASETPAFEPGSDWAYSNSGFILLGRLIEVASGEDYYDYVARHVLAPAGMRDTGYFDRDGRAERVAIGYAPGPDRLRDDRDIREWRGGPAGGGFTTARDLLRFHDALTGGRLLPPEMTTLFFTPLALPGEGARRGAALGPLLRPVGDDLRYGHPGGSPGTSVEFWALRTRGLVIVVLSNVAPRYGEGRPPASALTRDIYAAIVAAGGPDLGGGPQRR